MAEKIFEKQINFGWGLSFNMTGKAPAVAKRIFDKYEDALAYANDVNDSAIEGLVLSVVADTEAKNGLYFVKQIATKAIEEVKDEDGNVITEAVPAKEAVLVKLSTNADSQATADEVQANLDSEISARTQADEALSGAIDTNIANIEALSGAIDTNIANIEAISGAVDVNAEAIEALSGAIDTNIANIEAVSGKADANAEAIEGINADIVVVSGAIDANSDAISALTDNFNTAVQEFQAADIVLSGAIDANSDAIDTINDTLDTLKVKNVKANDKVVAIDANGVLSSELSLEYISSAQTIELKGISGEVISTIDATDFIKDGMLSGVTLVKEEGKNTQMVFTFNTGDSAQTISLDVEEFLNADEVATLERSLEQHKGDTTLHFTTEEKTKLTNLYTKEELTAKFDEINSALTSNTQAHADLAAEIASANTNIAANKADIDAVSGVVADNIAKIDAVSGVVADNVAKIDEISGKVDTNIANIEAVSGKADANAEAIEGINANIEVLSGAIDTNIANIEVVSGKADANAEAIEGINADIEAVSGAVDANAEAIEGINADIEAISGVIDTNIAKIDEISGKVDTNIANIEAVSGEVKTLTDRVAENEKVASEALNDLRATKVSAIKATEKSNIVVTESKDENGISYTIDFQWLEF